MNVGRCVICGRGAYSGSVCKQCKNTNRGDYRHLRRPCAEFFLYPIALLFLAILAWIAIGVIELFNKF